MLIQRDAKNGVLTFQGALGFGAQGKLFETFEASSDGFRVPVGQLANGAALASQLGKTGERVALRFASGVALDGTLCATTFDESGRLLTVRLSDYQLGSERAGFVQRGAEYLLIALPELTTAHAGASDPGFFPEGEASHVKVPKPRALQEREQALLALYERSISAFRGRLGGAAVSAFAQVHRELTQSFPDEWLLRWNLLECLCKLAEGGSLSRTLESELLSLELKFLHREPIASGLRYLSALAA